MTRFSLQAKEALSKKLVAAPKFPTHWALLLSIWLYTVRAPLGSWFWVVVLCRAWWYRWTLRAPTIWWLLTVHLLCRLVQTWQILLVGIRLASLGPRVRTFLMT